MYQDNVVHLRRWSIARAERNLAIASAELKEHDRRHAADAALIKALKSNVLFELASMVEKRHSLAEGEHEDAKALVNKLVIEIGTVVLLALDKPKKKPSAKKKRRIGRKHRKPAAM